MLDVFPAVSRGFKTCLFRPNSYILCCSVFQVVAPGYCQITEEDVALEQYAKRFMELRKGIEEEMSLHKAT
jgi:hypothetical protein